MLLSAVPSFAISAEPDLVAESALLIDMSTGTVLLEKNADAKMYPASMTKMMTCILALENLDLSEYITANGADLNGITGDKIGLYAGEEINTGTLISAMMVISGNDAAVVLATKAAGTVEAFADMMNAKAAEIGLENTHFVNPNGLHDENQYTTAKDMAKLATYCMQNEVFARIVARTEFTIPVTNKTSERYFKTTNALLADGNYKYEGCIGIKTGSTAAAGECLTAAATRGDTTLLSVVMKSEGDARFTDTIALFDWGFENFKTVSVSAPAEIPESVKVKGGKAKTVAIEVPSASNLATVSNDVNASTLDTKIVINDKVEAPVAVGDVVGKLQILDGKTVVSEYDITAKEAVEAKGGIDWHFPDLGGSLFMKILVIMLIILLALVLIVGIYILYDRKKTEKRKAARAARRAQLESQESQLRKEWEKTYHGRSKDEL